jgi:hypothetical protein
MLSTRPHAVLDSMPFSIRILLQFSHLYPLSYPISYQHIIQIQHNSSDHHHLPILTTHFLHSPSAVLVVPAAAAVPSPPSQQ